MYIRCRELELCGKCASLVHQVHCITLLQFKCIIIVLVAGYETVAVDGQYQYIGCTLSD